MAEGPLLKSTNMKWNEFSQTNTKSLAGFEWKQIISNTEFQRWVAKEAVVKMKTEKWLKIFQMHFTASRLLLRSPKITTEKNGQQT